MSKQKIKKTVYIKCEFAIDVEVNNEDEAYRAGKDFFIDNLPDALAEELIDTDVVRIAETE